MSGKNILLLALFLGLSSYLQAQIMGFDEIDPNKVFTWQASPKSEYQGVYHFGASEAESDLLILIDGDIVVAQIRSGEFSVINGQTVWMMEYKNLRDVKIEKNMFSSVKYKGSFAYYESANETLSGLKIDNPWSGIPLDGRYEFGPKLKTFDFYFSGQFPQASKRLLKNEEMGKYSKSELQLMRNEIFARYGYIFRAGGKMETHFKKQDWYSPTHKDVNHAITEIERRNIQLIREWEGK